jgi:hypothetical protein
MCTPDVRLCPLFTALLHSLVGHLHGHTLAAVADLVWALLLSQSLHPADLARALPQLQTGHARQALRRVHRLLDRAVLRSHFLTPLLIARALQLAAAGEVTLVLDSTRGAPWEIFTLGVVFNGRVLVVAWEVLPYPWPKRQFTPTVLTLLQRTLAHWPTTRPVHLVADRGFPSLPFFRCLEQLRAQRPLGYTIRLRASDWVYLPDGVAHRVGDLEAEVRPGQWTRRPASYRKRGRAGPTAFLILGQGEPVYPAHQRGPADCARRAQRAVRRLAHVRSKSQSPARDQAWALLSVETTSAGAVARYSLRFHTEPTYRDVKSWHLEAVLRHQGAAALVDSIVGLGVLAYFIQAAIGAAAGCADEASVQARQQQWCTTDRLSVFWRGRQVLQDRAHDWGPWLTRILPTLTARLTIPATPTAPAGVAAAACRYQEAA